MPCCCCCSVAAAVAAAVVAVVVALANAIAIAFALIAVIPAKAGIHASDVSWPSKGGAIAESWIPAYAGMTIRATAMLRKAQQAP